MIKVYLNKRISLAFFVLFLPQVALAQMQGFPNQAWTAGDIIGLLDQFKNFLMFVGIILIIAMILISGLTMLLAAGNEQKVGMAKKMLLWSVLGAVVILGSIVILNTIIRVLQSKSI